MTDDEFKKWEAEKLLPLQEEITKLRLDLAKKHIDGIELAKMHGQGFATAVEHLCALRKQEIVSLQRQVAMLIGFIKNAQVSSGVCCCGEYMDGHSSPMIAGHSPVDVWDNAVDGLITNTQATAEAYDREHEKKVLEKVINKLMTGKINLANGYQLIEKLRREAAELSAANKKEPTC